MAPVECAECGRAYDGPFCPQCGSTKVASKGAVGATPLPRIHPRRRGVQMAGAIVTTLGLLYLLGMVATGTHARELLANLAPALETQAGGPLELRLTENGTAMAHTTVQLRDLHGKSLANGTTGAGGGWNVAAPHAVVAVYIPSLNYTRVVYALPGAASNFTIEVRDGDHHALAPPAFSNFMVAMIWVLAVVAAVVFAGGLAALLVMGRPLALAGAGFNLLLTAIVTVASLSIILMVIFALCVYAFVLVWRGKAAFVKAR